MRVGPNAGKNCSAPDGFEVATVQAANTKTKTKAKAKATRAQAIHVSANLNGPWTMLSPNMLPECTNPAPHIHANGTFFIVCNHHLLYRSPTIHGPVEIPLSNQEYAREQ